MRVHDVIARVGVLLAATWMPACGGDQVAGSAGMTTSTGSSGQVQTTSGQPTTSGTPGTTDGSTTSGVSATMASATMGSATMASNPTFPETTTLSTSGVDTTGTTTDATSTGGEPFCGDGNVDPGEECDEGEDNGAGRVCNQFCRLNVCGDGDQGIEEECDDGADNSDIGSCKLDCTNNICGDGNVGPGEGCDDGNQNDNDECGNYSSFPATAPTRQLTSKLHGRNRWVFPRPARGPPTASPRPCPPGLEKSWRRELT